MMRIQMLFCFMLVLSSTSYGQNEAILEIFNQQVEAFNRGDTDRLVDNVSQDFKWYYITPDSLLLEVDGRENFRKNMEAYFSVNMKVKSKIENYVIQQNKVSFKEVVTYPGKDGEMVSVSATGIYEIKKGKIYRTWYFIE